MKKGAMFGLDARIALAIFGALSVISGAALYGAIQDAKVISFITEIDNIEKAYAAYVLDTGVDPKDQNYYTPKMSELVVNDANVSNWNGPYISYSKLDTVGSTKSNNYSAVLNFRRSDAAVWGMGASQVDISRSCSGDCYIYVDVSGIDNNFIDLVDKKLDGEVNASEGRVRKLSSSRMLIRINLSLKQS